MAHPFQSHREDKIERSRVAKLTGAAGVPSSHGGITNNKTVIKGKNPAAAMKVEGAKSSGRLDKYARGGAVKKGSTNVNVIIAPQGGAGGPPPLPLPPAGGAPPMAPPAPPPGMAGPPVPQKDGGRTRYAAGGKVGKAGGGGAWGVTKYDDGYVTGERHGDTVYVNNAQSMSRPVPAMIQAAKAKAPGITFVAPGKKAGGRVNDGAAWKEGLKNGTQVQHTDGKNDGKDIYRAKQITYAKGGVVGTDDGAGSGPGRLEKITLQRKR